MRESWNNWRAGASLPSRPNGAIFLYIYLFIYLFIYLYPALMYAVMFYVILNKRKLHFPLAKNVMHSPSNNVITGSHVCTLYSIHDQ